MVFVLVFDFVWIGFCVECCVNGIIFFGENFVCDLIKDLSVGVLELF